MRAESTLQRTIRDYLAAHGYQSVAVPNGAVLRGDKDQRGRQMANLKRDGLMVGFPDLLVYGHSGRLAHIEVKTPQGKPSPAQEAVAAWLIAWGHNYALCRSTHDVDEALAQWGWIK